MQQGSPWKKVSSALALRTEHMEVYRDQVRRPDGEIGPYDWVSVSDQVRVAAVIDGCLLLVEQHHYLVGQTLQLPGGNLDGAEPNETAARRELREEAGYIDGAWASHGYVTPLPGLTPSRVYLWSARDLTAGQAAPESSERDLRTRLLRLETARQAVLDGRVICAASAALILQMALDTHRERGDISEQT